MTSFRMSDILLVFLNSSPHQVWFILVKKIGKTLIILFALFNSLDAELQLHAHQLYHNCLFLNRF